jgi:hypothetical protein
LMFGRKLIFDCPDTIILRNRTAVCQLVHQYAILNFRWLHDLQFSLKLQLMGFRERTNAFSGIYLALIEHWIKCLLYYLLLSFVYPLFLHRMVLIEVGGKWLRLAFIPRPCDAISHLMRLL